MHQFSSLLSCVRLCNTMNSRARQASLSITNSQSPPKPMSIELVKPSNHLILCWPLLLLPSIFPSIRVFSNESALCMRWPKSWSSASALVLPMWSNSKSKPCPFTVLISMPTAKLHDQLTTAISSVQSSSVAQSSPTLCDPMNCSTPGLAVLHSFLEFAQTDVRWVGDALQLSHPLLPPSPPALNLSHHQGLFQWVGSLHQVVKVLALQHLSFQWIFRVEFL